MMGVWGLGCLFFANQPETPHTHHGYTYCKQYYNQLNNRVSEVDEQAGKERKRKKKER